MQNDRTPRSVFGPEARELARWAIGYFAPRSVLPDLGYRRRARFGEALFWLAVGAAAGATAVYLGGPGGAEHRRELATWWRTTFATTERDESVGLAVGDVPRRDGGARTGVRDSVRSER